MGEMAPGFFYRSAALQQVGSAVALWVRANVRSLLEHSLSQEFAAMRVGVCEIGFI